MNKKGENSVFPFFWQKMPILPPKLIKITPIYPKNRKNGLKANSRINQNCQ